MEILLSDVIRFVLVLSRQAALLVALPIFGGRQLPMQIKVMLAISLSFAVFLGLPSHGIDEPGLDLTLVFIIVRETLIGLLFGFVASLVFRAVEYAGELIGMQMGFSIANVIDPQSGQQNSIIAEWQKIILVLVFFAINGHLMLLRAAIGSYEVVPISGTTLGIQSVGYAVTLVGDVFAIALQLAAPATIMLLLTHLVLAVISRAVPQMNVFIVGFPLTIAVGVGMLALSIPAFTTMVRSLLEDLPRDFALLMRAM